MKRLQIMLSAVALIVCSTTVGQNLSFGGAVLNHDGVMAGELAQLSQTQPFGTARSMAMGGAFVSLGADLSSMSINPAGLGMYQHNELVLTPMMTFQSSSTADTAPFGKNTKSRFAVPNFGVALNTFQSSGTLTSLTIGIGMNRIADFNSRYSYQFDTPYSGGEMQAPSLADVFGRQLEQAGIFPNNNGALGYDYANPYFWPAILGYNGYMISSFSDNDGSYYVPDCIGSNASILHYMDVVNSGSINEFELSLGANFNNIVYFGATLGIQSVHKSTGIYYGEDYRYENGLAVNSDGVPLSSQLDYADLYQHSVLDGSGVNLKLGVIIRPVESLRIGVAFHTPTYYSLERSYYGTINSQLYNNDTGDMLISDDSTPSQDDMGSNSWCFTSPARLMFGISYTLGNFGVISVDYERDWYNSIRVKNTPDGFDIYPEEYKAEFKQAFKGTNTLRAGIEIKPIPLMALRVGGGFTGSMFKDRNNYYDMPLTYRTSYVSAGIGFNLSRAVSLDLAYQYMTSDQTPYQLFYSLDRSSGAFYDSTGLFNTKSTRHNAVMSLAFHF